MNLACDLQCISTVPPACSPQTVSRWPRLLLLLDLGKHNNPPRLWGHPGEGNAARAPHGGIFTSPPWVSITNYGSPEVNG